MLNKNEELKTALFCVVALLVGLLCVVLTGCDKFIDGEPKFDLVIPQSEYEMHDLTFPVTEYDANKVAMLEVICCEGCGFVPWTDSWCEFHDVRSSTAIQNMEHSLSRGL